MTPPDSSEHPVPPRATSAVMRSQRGREWVPPLEEMQAVLEGQPYRVESLAGSGGMGAVFKVYRTDLQRHEALKLMHPAGNRDPDFKQRFKNEVAILAKLDHAGLTTVYHSGSTAEGFLWYTMAWLDGRNLAEELTSHPPGPARVMEILLSVLHSLRYIHSQGIIHRDLKPANIMLCNDGRVRLLDFGIARYMERKTDGLTGVGEFVGSEPYASPERMHGRTELDLTADLFSLGRVLEEMIATLRARDVAAHAFPGDDQLIDDLTAYEPRLRPRTADEVVRRLDADGPGVTWPADQPPFPGLASYQPERAAVFFGREDAVQRACARLYEAPGGCAFLMVLGASGSGKSSLACAGIAPALLTDSRQRCAPVICTPETLIPESDCLLAPLARRLAETVQPDTRAASALHRPLTDALAGARSDLAALLDLTTVPPASPDDSATLPSRRRFTVCLVLDQFETLFRLAVPPAARTRFIQALERLARTPGVAVIATLRSDAFHHCTADPLCRLVEGRSFPLPPPEPWEISRLLRLSARAAGLSFERDAQGRSLDEVLLHETRGHPQPLPLLSFVLEKLWQHRRPPSPAASAQPATAALTFAAYENAGGLHGAIAAGATGALTAFRANFPDAPATALDELFDLLITSVETDTGTTFDIRLATPAALSAASDPARQLATYFVNARLLIQDTGGLSLAHKTLLSPAVASLWPELKSWLDQNAETLRLRTRIESRCRDWLASTRDPAHLLSASALLTDAANLCRTRPSFFPEQPTEFIRLSEFRANAAAKRNATVRRRVVIALSSLAAAAIVAAGMFWHQRREAVAARDTTEKVRQNAEALLTNITHDFRATVEAKVGSLNALKEIAASAGQYYENLPASLRDERSLRLELVNGLLRADIARNANELEASLAEATAVKQSLAATSVQRGGDWWLLKSRAEIATAEVLEKQDRQAEAISEGHAAIESARRALQEANQPEAKRWLAVALLTAAQAQTSTKSPAMADLAAAEKFLEEARALIAAVNTSRPPLLDHARQQGWILYESGQVAKKHASPSLKDPTAADHLVQAKRFYAEASAVLEKALEADSANISVRRDLLAVQDALGDCEGLSQPPDYAAALQFHTQALDTARWLSLRDPDNASWQRELASAQTNLADDLVHLHRFAEATALLGQALGIHRVLVSRQPGDMDSRRSLVDACIRCGKLWLAAGKLEEALADFTSAQQAVEAARTQDPASTSAWTGRTIAILLRLGEVELKRKPSDHAKVRTLYEKALALGTELEKAGKLSSVDEKNLKEVRLLLKTLSAP